MTPIKKIAVLGALLAALGAGRLTATVLVTEVFDYADGTLNGKSGGTGFSGNWSVGANGTGTVTVSGGAAVVTGIYSTWGTRALSLASSSSSSFYFSYDISSSAAATLATGSFVDALLFKSGGATLFRTGIYYYKDGFRLQGTGGSTSSYLTTLAATTVNTVYTVVGKFTFDDGAGNAVLSIWINPTTEASAPTYTSTWASTATSVTSIVLQRFDDNGYGGGSSTVFDDIVIGADWASVTAIPEPRTAAALAGMAGFVLVAARRWK